jgi:hypothetical protein
MDIDVDHSNINTNKRTFEELVQAEQVCQDLKNVLDQIVKAKQSQQESAIQTLLGRASTLMLDLKQTNRDLQFELESRKLHTQNEKNHLDDLNFKLETLLYKRNHLKASIHACKQFT